MMLSAAGNVSDGEKYRDERIENSDDALNAVFVNAFRALQYTKDMTVLKGAANFLSVLESRNTDQVMRWAANQTTSAATGYVPSRRYKLNWSRTTMHSIKWVRRTLAPYPTD
ncbi:hypothetical protein [Hymenobacter sp. AT01-02]|uniref:hypothetical protein n=1 Tax=Hymenobacter sp. AT01-02 TaxID=1571877 RepID=UPI0006E281D0|nr:hypothetical protein [Hymenobacter sp. AT01-02]